MTQTTETRLREENKETDKPETALDGHTESYDDDRWKPEAPTTIGPMDCTGRATRTRKEEGNHQVRRTYKVNTVGSSPRG